MTTRLSRAERRRKERQRKRILNLLIFSGVALIVVAFFLWASNRPVDDLVIPSPPSYPVPVDGLTIGNPDAEIHIEVFEDFQCPSCLRFSEDFKPLVLQNYVFNGRARFTFHNYPFIGPESTAAANAAMCANEQGQFWAYHDTLFANQLGENIGAFSDRRLSAMAEQLGLDMSAWESCFDQEKYDELVQADFADGRSRGVSGTPTVFVNGVMLPSFDFQTIATAVEQAAAGQQ